MPAKPQSCHVCLVEPSLCFPCQQLLSNECKNQVRLQCCGKQAKDLDHLHLFPSRLPHSLRQRTHNSWKLNYIVNSCSKVQSLAIGSVRSSRFSVQLIGAAAIPAVRQGTHSAERPEPLHEHRHREYLGHAGNVDHKMLWKAMTGFLSLVLWSKLCMILIIDWYSIRMFMRP